MRRIVVLIGFLALVTVQIPAAQADHPPEWHGHNPSPLPVTFAMEETPTGDGYWTMDAIGGVFTHGDASFHGSLPDRDVPPVTASDLASTSDGNGYWILDEIGGVHTFGNATFHGSVPGLRNAGQAIANVVTVAVEPDPTGPGYWVLDEIGGVFSFDAPFFGSLPGRGIPAGATDMAAIPAGNGYWVLDEIGGVHTFGDAPFFGSLPGRGISTLAVAIEPTPDGGGYWVLDVEGGIHTFGNARFFGSANPAAQGGAFDLAASPHGTGYWVLLIDGTVITYPGGVGEPAGDEGPECDPSYPDVCIPPPPPDLDCGDTQHRNFSVEGDDPHNFDADGNGVGCES